MPKTMPSSPADNAIMTIGGVADFLKVTERNVCRLAAAKKISACKDGGCWRFCRTDFYIWIKQQALTKGFANDALRKANRYAATNLRFSVPCASSPVNHIDACC